MSADFPDQILHTLPRYRAEDLGAPLPPSVHANSVCLPMWQDVIDYEEKRVRVIEKLQAGYPRFVIPPLASRFFEQCRLQLAGAGERCAVYPSHHAARRCVDHIRRWSGADARVVSWEDGKAFVVIYPEAAHESALKYWRHTGDGISSRRAEALLQGVAEPDATKAKAVVRQRIADLMGVPAGDVYLFKTGMAAIYSAHRALMRRTPGARSVQFGFPYVDTLKIQQDLGPGAAFFPFGNDAELKPLAELAGREKFSAIYCEYPSNPLLLSPDLSALAEIAGKHRIPVVVDDTISTYANVNPLPACDLVVTSLTKFFTGRGDVMAGAIVLNPKRPLAGEIRAAIDAEYEDTLWGGDALFVESYSRDFVERMHHVNATTLELCTWLEKHPAVAHVFYPGLKDTAHYDAFKRRDGGYSGLFSLVLKNPAATSAAFFDQLEISKGPNLGTTFSLCCPFTLLAHYSELDWAEQCGVSRYLIRFSIGLETASELIGRFERALPQTPA